MSIILLKRQTGGFKAFQRYVEASQYQCSDLTGKQTIGSGYVEETVNKCDYIICITDNHLSRKLFGPISNYSKGLKGFACISVFNTHLYVDLICGRGSGKLIFQMIDNLALQLNKPEVRLSAVPEAMMTYYGLYKFKFSNNCSQTKDIQDFANYINSIIKDIRTLQKQQQIKNTRLTTKKLQQAHLSYKKQLEIFQQLLIDHNLAHDKKCRKPSTCAINGYEMTKCIKPANRND